MNKDRETAISKTLSWLLRHAGQKEGLKFRSDAFVKVNDVLNYKKLKSMGLTLDELKYLVEINGKQRFVLQEEDNVLWIKAAQGHSMVFADIGLKQITSVDEIAVAIHGTYYKNLASIMKDGLKTMGRTHIHFAIGKPKDENVTSGMRSDCQVLIYLDVQKCLNDGIELFVSENNVVLTAGVDGTLDTKYFAKVVDAKSGNPVKL